jgi:hypothetical protein
VRDQRLLLEIGALRRCKLQGYDTLVRFVAVGYGYQKGRYACFVPVAADLAHAVAGRLPVQPPSPLALHPAPLKLRVREIYDILLVNLPGHYSRGNFNRILV